MRFSWSLVIFIARCDASWPQLPDTALCDGTLGLFQRKLGRQERRAVQTEKPWEKRVYLVGTCHKVGSQLLRNVMEWTFDALGAKESCQYGGMGVPITFYTPEHTDCAEHPSSIRFDNHIDGDTISELRKETHNTGGFRGVMMIRDPVDMVISAYSYHHRGAEPDSIYAQGMVELTPAEGVPAMASRMLDTVEVMVQAAKNAEPDVMLVSFERMTKSSASFNQTVQDMVEFLFTDEISKLDQQKILNRAVQEDLHRGYNGLSSIRFDDHWVNHTNDAEDMELAKRAWHVVPATLSAEYQRLRKELGYA
ncbi:unnamed protein product [Durusdinium trenchii]|uniref:Sulfotransferase domain-containing protein n=1 Tax=Durusdinium trenchii TaxID=1381693 RepID=A0ABP0I3D6_9DINO